MWAADHPEYDRVRSPYKTATPEVKAKTRKKRQEQIRKGAAALQALKELGIEI